MAVSALISHDLSGPLTGFWYHPPLGHHTHLALGATHHPPCSWYPPAGGCDLRHGIAHQVPRSDQLACGELTGPLPPAVEWALSIRFPQPKPIIPPPELKRKSIVMQVLGTMLRRDAPCQGIYD